MKANTEKKAELLHLIRFVEDSAAFDFASKKNLILFIANKKPCTYVRLRLISNFDDKHEFERLLCLNGFLFKSGKQKGFEEITKVQGNAVKWEFKGTYVEYDLFHTKKQQDEFQKYAELVKKQEHKKADLIAGQLYGYPLCCLKEHILTRDADYLRKKYTHESYYSKMHKADAKFPFISILPCKIGCTKAAKLNNEYKNALAKTSPAFQKEFSKKRTYKNEKLLVDTENDTAIWHSRKTYDYTVITRNKIEGKHILISYLSDKELERGTILDATLTLQHNNAKISSPKMTGKVKNLHHERKFVAP